MTDHYDVVNAAWPKDIPPCSREEAKRAALKLMLAFAGRRYSRHVYVRKCWIAASEPYNDIRRGWRRLVHDLSHIVYRIEHKRGVFHAHGGIHARLEHAMIQHVLEKGWLTGKLKEKVAPKATPTDKAARIAERIKRWESKLRRAETALKKLRRTARYYEKREVA